jgi:hypothetical protein
MILRLTAKLGKKIGSMPAQSLALDENPFADWVGHLFTAQRVQYIILSNTASLYSIIMFGRGIASSSKFAEQSIDAMGQFMCDDGLEFIFRRLIVPHSGTIRYSKINDRRVLGSIVDMVYRAQLWLTEREVSPFEASRQINETPLSYLQHNYPREIFTGLAPGGGIRGPAQSDQTQEGQNKETKQQQNQLTDKAMAKWEAIPRPIRTKLLGSVWCGSCSGVTTIVNFDARMENQDLILRGQCAKCGQAVARVIEGE